MKVFFIKNKILKSFVVFALCACLLAQLSACATNKKTVQNGIEVLPAESVNYSNDDKQLALETLTELFTKVYKKFVSNPKPEKLAVLQEHASQIKSVIEKENLSKNDYRAVFLSLKDNSDAYADAIAAINNGGGIKDTQTLKSALSLLSSIIGVDKCASIFYESAIYYYDATHKKLLAEYEKYGYGYKLEEANAALSDKQILQNGITKQNFIPVVKLAFLLSELFLGGAFDSPLLESFSENEILILLKTPNFTTLNISTDGWQLLIKLFSKLFALSSLQNSVFLKASTNGDLAQIAGKLNDAVKLFCATQERFNEQSVSVVIGGNTEQIIKHCFSNFDGLSWTLFEKITTLNLNNEEYNQEGVSWHGAAYTDYLSTLPTVTLNDLKAAANSDDGEQFTYLLKNYFAGICPAFFYGASV